MLWVAVAGTLRFSRSAPQKCYDSYKVLGVTARLCTSSFMLEPFFHLNNWYVSVPVLKLFVCSWFASVEVRGASVHLCSVFLASLKESLLKPTHFSTWWSNAISQLTGCSVPFVLCCLCMQRGFFPRLLFDFMFSCAQSVPLCLYFSVTVFKNCSNPSLLPSQRKGTTTLLYWVNAFSYTCSWMGDYLNILNTLLIGIMMC